MQRAKKGKDEAHKNSTKIADFIPTYILEPLGFGMTYIAACVGVDLPPLLSKK